MSLSYINSVLLALFLLVAGLFYTRAFLVPLILGALFAILLVPLASWLERYKFSRGAAAALSVGLAFIVLAAFVVIVTLQVWLLVEHFPVLQKKFLSKIAFIQQIAPIFNVLSLLKTTNYLEQLFFALSRSFLGVLQQAFFTTLYFGTTTIILVFYVFFFLYYRDKLKVFVLQAASYSEKPKAAAIVERVYQVASQYLRGLGLIAIILALLNMVGLLLLGIPYAVFLGILTGLLNIIPYIGVLIGGLISLLIAWLTTDSLFYPAMVLAWFIAVQLFDNHFLRIFILGSQVDLNPLATLIAAVTGGLLWGLPGIIIFIPLIAIVKVVCDHVDSLKPYGTLLGKN